MVLPKMKTMTFIAPLNNVYSSAFTSIDGQIFDFSESFMEGIAIHQVLKDELINTDGGQFVKRVVVYSVNCHSE